MDLGARGVTGIIDAFVMLVLIVFRPRRLERPWSFQWIPRTIRGLRRLIGHGVAPFMMLATGPMRNHTPPTPWPFVWPGAVSPA